MDEENAMFTIEQMLLSQPAKQFVSIVSQEHVVKRVLGALGNDTLTDCEEMEVMVAKDSRGGFPETFDKPQDGQRIRAAIDEIPHKPQPIMSRIKLDLLEELLERREAPLDVANGVGGHSGGWSILKSHLVNEKYFEAG
jgi:hypothetical protein